MKRSVRNSLVATALAAVCTVALAATARVGNPAPDFTLTDGQGKPVKLSDFKGRYVVLEWVNPDCPFVVKHYDSDNLPGMQRALGEQDVAWLVINSTHPGHGNYRTAAQMDTWLQSKNAAPTAMLLDPEGTVGRMYNAKTTPHMYVITPQGELIYDGAIDSIRSASQADISRATNYVQLALQEARAGKPVSNPVTTAYGCTIKYPR
jgi:hypothetical protein